MPRKTPAPRTIKVNRAPVLTLWAAVAERLGFDREETFTLWRALAGLNAYSKGVSLGLFTPTPKDVKEKRKKLRAEETTTVDLLASEAYALYEQFRPAVPAGVKGWGAAGILSLDTIHRLAR